MTDLPLPILAVSKCTGCGVCVEVCPAACLEKGGAVAWLPRPGDCISCAACAAVCPTHAIAMEE